MITFVALVMAIRSFYQVNYISCPIVMAVERIETIRMENIRFDNKSLGHIIVRPDSDWAEVESQIIDYVNTLELHFLGVPCLVHYELQGRRFLGPRGEDLLSSRIPALRRLRTFFEVHRSIVAARVYLILVSDLEHN